MSKSAETTCCKNHKHEGESGCCGKHSHGSEEGCCGNHKHEGECGCGENNTVASTESCAHCGHGAKKTAKDNEWTSTNLK